MIISNFHDYGMSWNSHNDIDPYKWYYWEALRQCVIDRAYALSLEMTMVPLFSFEDFVNEHPVLKFGFTDSTPDFTPFAKTIEALFDAAEDLTPYFINPDKRVEPILHATPIMDRYSPPSAPETIYQNKNGMELNNPAVLHHTYIPYTPGHISTPYTVAEVYDLCLTNAVSLESGMLWDDEVIKRRMFLLYEYMSFLKYKAWYQPEKTAVKVTAFYSLRPYYANHHGHTGLYLAMWSYIWALDHMAWVPHIEGTTAEPWEYPSSYASIIWTDPYRYVEYYNPSYPPEYHDASELFPNKVELPADLQARTDILDLHGIVAQYAHWSQDDEWSLVPDMGLPSAGKRADHDGGFGTIYENEIQHSGMTEIWQTACLWIKYDSFLYEGGDDWKDKLTEFFKLIPSVITQRSVYLTATNIEPHEVTICEPEFCKFPPESSILWDELRIPYADMHTSPLAHGSGQGLWSVDYNASYSKEPGDVLIRFPAYTVTPAEGNELPMVPPIYEGISFV